MKAIYRIQVACRCPVDDLGDLYDVTIESKRIIKAEDIMSLAVSASSDEAVFQEQLCKTWARTLGARVTMTGWHGSVFVEVTCE